MASDETLADMTVQQAEGHLVESRPGGVDPRNDVDAVAILLCHPGHSTDLTLDPGPVGAAVGSLVALSPRRWVAMIGRALRRLWTTREPGRWLLHCHIPHHATNSNVEEQRPGDSP